MSCTVALFCFTAGWSITFRGNFIFLKQLIIIVIMNRLIRFTLEIRSDEVKSKPVKVASYIRVRKGKKELVKGYVRKNRTL